MKSLKVTMKPVKLAVQKHILECVYDYEENVFSTLKDACNHLNNEFIRVAGHEYNLKRYPNNVERFIDYLQGIPFHFEFTNSGIEDFLNSLGINEEKKEYTAERMWNLYGLLIYREMIKNL
jgi:hypothetical protein